jgi:RHS repeat-associated protein
LLVVLVLVAAGCRFADTLPPAPGFMQYMAPLVLPVPGGSVSLATGNLAISRNDLSVETDSGPFAVGATYNSADNTWRWSFDMTHDGHYFTDASGARHDVSRVGIGETIPGTRWVVVDGSTMRTKSGVTYAFEEGALASIHWWRNPEKRISVHREVIAGESRVTTIGGFTLEYSSAGNLERITDRAGRAAEFQYDAAGQLVEARDALDIEKGWPGTHYGYTTLASGQSVLSSQTNSEGERIEYEYEGPRSQLSRVVRIGEENPETLFHYSATDTAEFETQVTHPDGGVATYRYDSLWRLLAFENEAGETQTFTWTAMKLASRTNAAGLTTSWSYEIEKDVIPGYVNSPIPVRERVTETQPSGNVVVSLYDRHAMHLGAVGAWPLLSREDSLGLLETRSYDDAGRVLLIDNGAGESISFEFYPEGGVFAEGICRSHDSSCAWGTPLYGYDKRWREDTISATGHLIRGAIWQYDEVGNLLKGGGTATPTSAGRPGIASRGFNADRELTSIEYWSQETYDSEQLSIERRSDGQPTRITRPYGADTEFDYDTLGRIVSRRERVDGAWQASHWEYDGRDRVTAVEKPNGMRTETRYDGVGRIMEIKHLRDGVMEKVVWLMWSNGRVAVRFDSTQGANESFAYNGAGRVSSILYPAGESLEFDYDLRGRVTEKRYRLADGGLLRTLGIAYDAAGRIQELREDGNSLLEWTYTNGLTGTGWSAAVGWPRDGGSLSNIAYGNGVSRSFEAEPQTSLWARYRWSSTSGPGGWIEELQMDTQNDCVYESNIPVDCTRVTETALPTGRSDGYAVERYEFTPGTRVEYGYPGTTQWLEERIAGARVEASGVYDGFEDPTMETTGHWDFHDALGNRVFAADSYNPERNRLLSVVNAWVPHSYAYDAAGFVVERDGKVLSWDAMGRIARLGDDTFVWDSLGRPVAKTVAGAETRYLFGGTVEADANGSPTALDLGEVRLDLVTGDHLYRHLDFRNNVQFVTDEAGEVVQAYTYSAYGVAEAYDTGADDRTFIGGRVLGDLILIGERLYDPAVGRFLSQDPVYQVSNQYSYAEGDPVHYQDPDGRRSAFLFSDVNKVDGQADSVAAPGPEFTDPASLDVPCGVLQFHANINALCAGGCFL